MAGKRKPTSDAVEIMDRRYYEGRPDRLAELEEAKANDEVARKIYELRTKAKLSQRQLALRMSVPRTYVSKIENDKATPTLSSLQRLATALEISVTELLEVATQNPAREAEVRELMADEFISELVPFISKLDAMQRSSFLTQVRELTTRPRRSA